MIYTVPRHLFSYWWFSARRGKEGGGYQSFIKLLYTLIHTPPCGATMTLAWMSPEKTWWSYRAGDTHKGRHNSSSWELGCVSRLSHLTHLTLPCLPPPFLFVSSAQCFSLRAASEPGWLDNTLEVHKTRLRKESRNLAPLSMPPAVLATFR